LKVIRLVLGPLNTNCYIIYTKEKKAAVIDPAFSAEVIESAIEKCGLVLDKILLTHAHFDHIMAAEELHKAGVKLCLHAQDVDMLQDPTLNCMADFLGKSFKFTPPECLLEDGDVIELGGEVIRVMHTPGHTKGSVCYITDGIIFSGDTLFCGGVGRTDLYGGNYDTLMGSLKKLNELDGEYTVCPGHGESTLLSKERSDNIYMRYMR